MAAIPRIADPKARIAVTVAMGVFALAALVALIVLLLFPQKRHAVTFYAGDEVVASGEYAHGAELIVPEDPIGYVDDEGYVCAFTGWEPEVTDTVEADTEYTAAFEREMVSWEIDESGVLYIYPSNGMTGTLPATKRAADAPWSERRGDVKKVVVERGVNASRSADYLFADLPDCIEIKAAMLNTENCLSMKEIFAFNKSLLTLNVLGWDTSRVSEMKHAFLGCDKLETVIVGEGFSFTGDGTAKEGALPEVTSNGRTGKWLNAAGAAFAPADIPAGVASTYRAEKGELEEPEGAVDADVQLGGFVALPSEPQAKMVPPQLQPPREFVPSTTTPLTSRSDGPALDATPAYALVYNDGVMVLQRGYAPNRVGRKVVAAYTGFEDGNCVPWAGRYYASKVWMVVVSDEVRPVMMCGWFADMPRLVRADLSGIDTGRCRSMEDMFAGCMSLRCVTLGEKFDFRGMTGARLTALPFSVGYSYWQSEGTGELYGEDDVPGNMKDTYHAV